MRSRMFLLAILFSLGATLVVAADATPEALAEGYHQPIYTNDITPYLNESVAGSDILRWNGTTFELSQARAALQLQDDGSLRFLTDNGTIQLAPQREESGGPSLFGGGGGGNTTEGVVNVVGGLNVSNGLQALGGRASEFGVALGNDAEALGLDNVAIGSEAIAQGYDSVAIGRRSATNNDSSLALGFDAEAVAPGSTAIGYDITNSQADSIQLGVNSTGVSVVEGGAGVRTRSPDAALDVNGSQFVEGGALDVNGDQVVNTGDAGRILDWLRNDTELTDEEYARADLNGDGVVSAFEAQVIVDKTVEGPSSEADANDIARRLAGSLIYKTYDRSGSDILRRVGIGTFNPNTTLSVDGTFQLATGTNITEISTDELLRDDSDMAAPTEQAVKAYVDALADSVNGSATQNIAEVLNVGDVANDGQEINIDEVRARDGDGVRLVNDQGNGITVADSGLVSLDNIGESTGLRLDTDAAPGDYSLIEIDSGNYDYWDVALDTANNDLRFTNRSGDDLFVIKQDTGVEILDSLFVDAGLSDQTDITHFSTDESLSDNSDDAVPTEQAVRQFQRRNPGAADGGEGAVQFNDGGLLNGDVSLLMINQSTGRVGVGTSAPTELIDVNGTLEGDEFELSSGEHIADDTVGANGISLYMNEQEMHRFRWAGDTIFNLQRKAAADFVVRGGSEDNLLRVDAGDDTVGVATSDPQAQFDVNGTFRLQDGTSVSELSQDGSLLDESDNSLVTEGAIHDYVEAAATDVNGSATQTLSEVLAQGDTANDGQQINIDEIRARDGDGLSLGNDAGNGLFVDSSGNVGIGTNSPSQALNVAGSAVLQSGTAVNEFSTDESLSDNSDDAVPTEQAVKQYAENNDFDEWILAGDSGSSTITTGETVTVAGGSGLASSVSSGTATVDVNTGTGVEVSGDNIRVSSGVAGDGLAGGSGSALSVNAGDSLKTASDQVLVADDGIGNAEIDNDENIDLGTLDVSGGATGDGSQSGLTVDSSGNLYFSGSLNFPGNVNIVDQQVLNGSFLPSQDNTFNLGSASSQWSDAYLGGDLVMGGTTFTESNLDALADGVIGDSEVNNDLTIGTAGSVQAEAIDQEGASAGQVLEWTGSAWQPGTDNNGSDDQTLSTTDDVSGTQDRISIDNGNSITVDDDYAADDQTLSFTSDGNPAESSATHTLSIDSGNSVNIVDNWEADDQGLSYSNDNSPTGDYVTHSVNIDSGSNINIRDYYDPDTTIADDQGLPDVLSNEDTANDGQQINIDEIRARDGDGLSLSDDAGNGLFVSDGGQVGVGTSNPSQQLDVVGSAALQSGTAINEFSTDESLSDNSDNAVPTEQAVRQYVGSSNFDSWTIAGDSGSTSVSNGDTVTVSGGSAISTSESNRDVTVGLNTASDLEVSGGSLRIASNAAGSGIGGGSGSALAVNTGSGIETSSDNVRIASDAAGDGLRGGSGSSLSVNTGNALTTNSDSVAVASNSIQNSEIDNSVNMDFGSIDVGGGAAGDGSQSGLTVDSSGNLYFSGSLNFPGDVNTVNQQVLDGSFLPDQDNAFNLGSSTAQWSDVYLGGDLVMGGTTFTESNLDALADGVISDSEVNNDLTISTAGSVQAEAIDQEGASSGDVLEWDGSNWQPGGDSTGTDDQNLQATSRSGSTVTIPIEDGSSTSFTDNFEANTDSQDLGVGSDPANGGSTTITIDSGDSATFTDDYAADDQTLSTTDDVSGTDDEITIDNGNRIIIDDDFEANTDDQGLSYSNDNSPTGDYVTHSVNIDSGSNINIRDYYDPDTTIPDDQALTLSSASAPSGASSVQHSLSIDNGNSVNIKDYYESDTTVADDQDLEEVLNEGNSAGNNDINANGNNVDNVECLGDQCS